MFLNSDYYYAKSLVYAIEREDIASIEHILGKRPNCASTYPQILPERIFNTICENRGTTYPLIVACGMDNVEIVKMLVEAGADVNCNDGRTPLSLTYCAKKEHWYQISLYLIENGVSLDYVTEYSGGTPSVLRDIVHSGPESMDVDEADILAAFHYAIDQCDHNQIDWYQTLQRSILFNRFEVVQFLLRENYCNINDTDSLGWSALMQAANYSSPEMVQLLLDSGADKTLMDSQGKTAYDYAVEKDNDEIIILLTN
ncbi:MAG: ankyrin repeat domain-containing protein [Acetatifactor sp.]|nr:ankyrin repeat domain-containing protein [Acetatifactor sp.]